MSNSLSLLLAPFLLLSCHCKLFIPLSLHPFFILAIVVFPCIIIFLQSPSLFPCVIYPILLLLLFDHAIAITLSFTQFNLLTTTQSQIPKRQAGLPGSLEICASLDSQAPGEYAYAMGTGIGSLLLSSAGQRSASPLPYHWCDYLC